MQLLFPKLHVRLQQAELILEEGQASEHCILQIKAWKHGHLKKGQDEENASEIMLMYP